VCYCNILVSGYDSIFELQGKLFCKWIINDLFKNDIIDSPHSNLKQDAQNTLETWKLEVAHILASCFGAYSPQPICNWVSMGIEIRWNELDMGWSEKCWGQNLSLGWESVFHERIATVGVSPILGQSQQWNTCHIHSNSNNKIQSTDLKHISQI
jgi:hypothetical protein